MGNTDSAQILGEKVVAGKRKLEQERAIQSKRYEYLVKNSPEALNVMMESIAESFQTCSPFLEPTLLIAWQHNLEKCKKIILDSCRKVLSTLY